MRTSSMAFGLVSLAMAAFVPTAIGQIEINESSFGGDFNDFSSPTVIAPALGLGVNTITGRMSGAGDDFDSFWLTFPAGTSITSISLTVTNYESLNATVPSFFRLFNSNQPPFYPSAEIPGNGTFALTFNLADVNTFWLRVDSPRNPGVSVGSFDYVVNLTVVPTPGATAMLGMGALAAARRRR